MNVTKLQLTILGNLFYFLELLLSFWISLCYIGDFVKHVEDIGRCSVQGYAP